MGAASASGLAVDESSAAAAAAAGFASQRALARARVAHDGGGSICRDPPPAVTSTSVGRLISGPGPGISGTGSGQVDLRARDPSQRGREGGGERGRQSE